MEHKGSVSSLEIVGPQSSPARPAAAAAALILLVFGFIGRAHAADIVPPVITATNKIAECAGATTAVSIGPTVVDDQDPSPTTTFSNGLSDQDPDAYGLGAHLVQVRACDATGNCSQRPVVVDVRDTVAPNLTVPPSFALECTSPNGTPGGISAASFVVTEACDASPTLEHDLPAGGLFPLGNTTVTVTATDATGNTFSRQLVVAIHDTVAPAIVWAPPDFTVVSAAGECTPEAGGSGTLVTLPGLNASDACAGSGGGTLTWAAAGVFVETTEPTVCLPDGVTAVDARYYDAAGNDAADVIQVTVAPAAGLTIGLTVSGASGFRNTDATVIGTLTVADPAVSWSVGSTAPPASSSVDANGTLTMTFDAAGIYCPTYLTVSKGAAAGAGSACFGIDRQTPAFAFDGIAETWVVGGDPTVSGPVNPADPTTWPTYDAGESIDLVISAADAGSSQSGVARVRATLDPAAAAVVVLDRSPACPAVGGLATCPASVEVTACNVVSSACLSDGRVTLAGLAAGGHLLRIEVTDGAGNVTSRDYPFSVGSLPVTLQAASGWVASLLASPATPSGALADLMEARDLLTTADYIFYDSPGHAVLLVGSIWSRLDAAGDVGADTAFTMAYLARATVAEVERLVMATDDAGLTDWALLDNAPGDTPQTLELAYLRSFLIGSGAHTAGISQLVQVANGLLASARAELAAADERAALATALEAFGALAMLFDDSIYAALYGAEAGPSRPYEIAAGVPERYYRGSAPAHFGDYVARTVRNQIVRFTTDAEDGSFPGIPASAVTTMLGVRDSVDAFAAAVAEIRGSNWNLTDPALAFTNERLVREVYLNTEQALEQLRTIQSSSVYTHYWQTGLALTLAHVVNFSIYEGPTSLYNRIGPASLPAQLYTHAGGLPAGGSAAMDVGAQVAECRFHAVLYALADGRIEDAVDHYLDSKCLIIDVYNRLYGAGQVLPLDGPILPADFACPALLPPLILDDECPCAGGSLPSPDDNCDGLDNDCNGVPDDGYVAQSCGVSACASTSACVDGVELPCQPGSPPALTDATCDGQDDNCSGAADEDYVATGCGLGACAAVSSCAAGVESACVPAAPGLELCDGLDNNCNIVADEGLDADGDGYGCKPASLGGPVDCVRADEADRLCPADDLFRIACLASGACSWPASYLWDCDDHDPYVADFCGTCADADSDGYFVDCVVYDVFRPGPDCDDDAATGASCNSSCAAFYQDGDGDGRGNTAVSVTTCVAPPGYVATSGDCDDADGDNWTSCASCVDVDGDTSYVGCDRYVTKSGPDCDDAAATGATCSSTCSTFYPDADSDARGDAGASVSRCVAPAGYIAAAGDCDDADADNWTSCASCDDGDGDSHYVNCDRYVTRSGPDCNDLESTVWDNCNGLSPYVIGVESSGLTTFRIRFSEPVTTATATSLANYALIEDPVESGCAGSGSDNIAPSAITQLSSTDYTLSTAAQQCSTTTYRITASTAIVDSDEGNALIDPRYGTAQGQAQLRVIGATCTDTTHIRVTFSKAVQAGSGAGGAESTTRYQLSGPVSLGAVTSAVLSGTDTIVLTHASPQTGGSYAISASNGIDGDGFDDVAIGAIQVSGGAETLQATAGDRALFTGCGTSIDTIDGGAILRNPFGDGSDFGLLTYYGNQVYIGPSRLGNTAVRFNPDGTSPTTLQFRFARDSSSSAGGTHLNTGGTTYVTLGHTGCTANNVSTTTGCGPDNENGRGHFFSGRIGTVEHLFIGGSRTAADFDYVYYTRDTDATLDFAYIDLGDVTGSNTNALSSGMTFNDNLYVGFARQPNNRPDFGRIKFSGGSSCTATQSCDVTGTRGLRFDIHYMNYFGGQASSASRNWAYYTGIDAMIVFNDRLYTATGGHPSANHNGTIIRSNSNLPDACSGAGACSSWTDVGPRSDGEWHDGNLRWSLELTKPYDLIPGDRAFSSFAEYGGMLFVTRTSCRMTQSGSSSADSSVHSLTGCNDGTDTNREAQLWKCTPGANNTCESGEWTLVGDDNSGVTNFGVAGNRTMSLLIKNGAYLYVGFDNTSGVRLYRTRAANPGRNSSDWEQVGPAGFDSPAEVTQFFSALSSLQSGRYYLYLSAGSSGVPVAVYRQVND